MHLARSNGTLPIAALLQIRRSPSKRVALHLLCRDTKLLRRLIPGTSRRPHIKRVHLALVELLPLLGLLVTVRHCCVLLLLELLEGHLGDEGRGRVGPSMGGHGIRLLHSLHLLDTTGVV